MKKVAITGANGFVGSSLVRKFSESGYTVNALIRANADRSLLDCSMNSNTELKVVDYNDINNLKDSLAGVDILIHNAAITRGKNKQAFIKHNVELTEKMVQIVNESKHIGHFLFISSQAASGPCNNPKKETDDCNPVSYYGESKYLAEKVIKNRCLKNYTIIRPCSVYGGGDRDFLQYFKMVKRGISAVIGMKAKYISLIFIDQLSDYILHIADNPSTFKETLFLSDGNCYSWDQFIDTLEDVIGRKTLRLRLPGAAVIPVAIFAEIIGKLTRKVPLVNWQKSKEIRSCHWICDSSKAINMLRPDEKSGSLKDNLAKTYEWYKENKWL